MYPFRRAMLACAVSHLAIPAQAAAQDAATVDEQSRAESATAAAADAFGEQVGLNQAGLYTPVQTRGFDLIASSAAFRLDGFYFHPAASPSEALIEGLSVNVGIAATALDLPSPTGVVAYRLRDPGTTSTLAVTTGLREEESPHVEATGTLVNRDASLGLLGHALWVPDANRSTGEDGETLHLAGIARWLPGPGTRLRLFGSYSRDRHDGDIAVLPSGDGVPPPLKDRTRYGPGWARFSGWSSNSGLLLDHQSGGWALAGSLVRSINHAERADVTLLEIDRDGRARGTLYHTPAVETRSTSAEAKAARMFRLFGADHRLSLAYRQRQTHTGRALAAAIPAGEFDLADGPEASPAPELPGDLPRGLDKVNQQILSLTYDVRPWSNLDVRLGAHGSRYRKRVRDFDGHASRNADRSLLYSASAVWRPSPGWQVFASAVDGLEESGTAPSAASNRGEVLPPVKARQYELGIRHELSEDLSLIIAGFDIRKPIYGLRPDGLYAPVGTVRHRGLEGSLTGRVGPGTRVVLGANLVQPRISGPQVEAGLVQRTAPGVSRFNATISIDQQITQDWSVDAFFLHEGRRRRDSVSDTEVRAVPWLILGTRYSRTIGSTELILRAQAINAADRKGWWATPFGPLVAVPPVTYRLMLTARI